jgi:hypothetical protein
MASLGPGNYVVVVLQVEGSKASNIKLLIQREPRTSTTSFLAGSVLPTQRMSTQMSVSCLRKLALTVDDLTSLSGNHVRVPLPDNKHQLVHVFSASELVLYMIANLRTPTQVVQAAKSTTHSHGIYNVPSTVDLDGPSLTLSKVDLIMY